MSISNSLNELLIISLKNGFSFSMQKEGDANRVVLDVENKTTLVNIPDIEDENLANMLAENIEALKDIVK